MTFLKDSKFFFTLYHAGKVNIILHVVSFSFLLYGLTVKWRTSAGDDQRSARKGANPGYISSRLSGQ